MTSTAVGIGEATCFTGSAAATGAPRCPPRPPCAPAAAPAPPRPPCCPCCPCCPGTGIGNCPPIVIEPTATATTTASTATAVFGIKRFFTFMPSPCFLDLFEREKLLYSFLHGNPSLIFRWTSPANQIILGPSKSVSQL